MKLVATRYFVGSVWKGPLGSQEQLHKPRPSVIAWIASFYTQLFMALLCEGVLITTQSTNSKRIATRYLLGMVAIK